MTASKENDHLAVTAHDIKQMLMTIMGRSALLRHEDLPPQVKKDLRTIELAATDAARMLKRLTDPQEQPSAGVATVSQVMDQSLELILPPDRQPWQRNLPAQGPGKWSAELDIPELAQVALPAQLLREVLNNLVTNALEVMPAGGHFQISAQVGDKRIQLVLQDSGPGVTPDLAEKIFEPHFSTSGKQGRGLGLAGCRDLLGPLGGTLTLNPDSGGGAQFILDLPRAQDLAVCISDESPTTVVDKPNLPGEVLVVDDEPSVREMLVDVFRQLECPVSAVQGGDQALAIFSPGRFTVALVDRGLPGMSGLELASLLRAQDPHIVLVLVTGWGNDDIATIAAENGFDISEEKPLTVGKIRQIMEQSSHLYSQRVMGKEET